tara:strand:- start:245 stop:2077 length:1833 start_codon:yes stop_codon:yes gene_type:complete
MCGIAGHIGNKYFSNKLINKICKAMDHRGPDANNYKLKKLTNKLHAIFFHSRLSIIDLNPRSNQPMEFNNNMLSFNGEIYNFKEIQNTIIKQNNIKMEGKSDTEVLLKALSLKGKEIIKQLNGMWAFAFYDYNKKQIILSRDRIGEKPLYYLKNNDGFYFASEINTLFLMIEHKCKLNLDHINSYMVEGYTSVFNEKKTFFNKIKELYPSENLTIDTNLNLKKETYWSLRYNPIEYSEKEYVSKVRDNFISSVNSRLISDVPICILLSGGMDSTSIASTAKYILNKNLPCFSVFNDAPDYNEIDMIKYTVKNLSLDHYPINISIKNPTKDIIEIIKHYASPMGTPSNIFNWKLFKSISKFGYKVSLMGTGGDEALTGYYEHFIFDLVEKYNSKKFITSEKNFKTHVLSKLNNPHLIKYKNYILNPDKRDHLYPEINNFINCLDLKNYKPTKEKILSKSILRNRMLNFLFYQGVRFNLSEIDLNSMRYSIENRAPLLDHNFLELCYQIPNKLLIKNGHTKYILRQAMKGLTPQKILNSRNKHSLNVPLSKLYNLRSKSFYNYLFEDNILGDSKIFNIEKIKNILNQEKIGNEVEKFIFRLINIKEFLKLYG